MMRKKILHRGWLSAEGPSSKDGVYFCSGGDQNARGHQGYVGEDGQHRLNILEVQRLICFMPKVVIAVVPGWAVGAVIATCRL
jgi:naphthoate synthase